MTKNFLTRYAELLLICFFSLFALLPLFVPGFFSMHDNEQVARLFELNNTLAAGNFPPRLSQNLGFGYDYPFFNFYPSFAYYVGEVFKLLGFSYLISTKLMIATGFILAALSMYLFTKEYFGRIGGIVSAVAYTYAPYHSVEVYVRGALAEFWAFVFLPLIFWGIQKIEKTTQKKYVLLTGIFIACLVVSHNLIAMISSIFVGIFCLYLLFVTKNRKSFVLHMILAGLLGLSLSAYFWTPSYFEKNLTQVDILTKEAGDYSQHFVYIRQFFNSSWGYGGSYPGPEDGLSFQVGITHLGLALLSLFVSVYFSVKKKRTVWIVMLFFVLFLLSLFLQTTHSKFIWDNFQPLWYMQFPWRFLVFTVFTSAFLSGSIFLLKMNMRTKLALASVFISLLILVNRDYFQPREFYVHATDYDYVSKEKIRWDTSSLAFEYVPKGVVMKKNVFNNSIVAITKDEIAQGSYTVISGDMNVTLTKDTPQSKTFLTDVMRAGNFRVNAYSFPGWKVFVDGKEISYTDNNKLKLITFPLSLGKHEITATFTDTIYRTIGNLLSLVSIVVIGLWPFINRLQRRYTK